MPYSERQTEWKKNHSETLKHTKHKSRALVRTSQGFYSVNFCYFFKYIYLYILFIARLVVFFFFFWLHHKKSSSIFFAKVFYGFNRIGLGFDKKKIGIGNSNIAWHIIHVLASVIENACNANTSCRSFGIWQVSFTSKATLYTKIFDVWAHCYHAVDNENQLLCT